LGISFGFVAAVITIAHASWFRLPAGIVDQNYVTVLRRTETEVLPVSLIEFEQVAALAPEISWFCVRPKQVETLDPAGQVQVLEAQLVSDGFFHELGVRAQVGGVSPAVDGAPAVVLSDAAWRAVFGGRDVVGDHVQVKGGPSLPVVGVAPPDFVGVVEPYPDIWVHNPPHDLTPPMYGTDEETARHLDRRWPSAWLFGVVPAGSDLSGLLAGVRSLLADYRFEGGPIKVEGSRTPSPDGTYSVTVMMFDFGINATDRLELVSGLETDPDLRRDVAEKTAWLVGIVILLLAMVFVSLVEFLMADNTSREVEQRVRIAIGAGPMDVFRAVIAENGVLIVAVALLAWVASSYALDVLLRFEPFSFYLGEASPNAQIAGLMAAGVLLAAAFLACMAYVSRFVSRPSVAFSHRPRLPRRAVRQVLLFVAAASLLTVMSLAGRYLGDARLSLGFENVDAALVTVERDTERYWESAAPLVEAVEAIPGVRAAAPVDLHPLVESAQLPYSQMEILNQTGLDDTPFYANEVAPGFFGTLGIELLAGRVFGPDARAEVVLSRSAAMALGGVEAVLGAPLTIKSHMGAESETTVVGVAANVPYGGYVALDTRMVYRPIPHLYEYQVWLIDAEPELDVAEALAESTTFAGWTVTQLGTMASLFREQFIAKRSMEIVLSAAAAFALLLALAGVANSLSRTIGEARSPIGIRLALGATSGELARGYLGMSMRDLALAGAAVCGLALVAKLAAPAFSEVLAVWLIVPALACLAGVCAIMSHLLVGRLARRSSVSALVHGTIAEAHPARGARVRAADIPSRE